MSSPRDKKINTFCETQVKGYTALSRFFVGAGVSAAFFKQYKVAVACSGASYVCEEFSAQEFEKCKKNEKRYT